MSAGPQRGLFHGTGPHLIDAWAIPSNHLEPAPCRFDRLAGVLRLA